MIADRLFGPLGMSTAGFGPPGTPGRVDQPWGHVTVAGRLQAVQRDNRPVMAPAGGVHCNMADWAKFAGLYARPSNGGLGSLLDGPTTESLLATDPGQTYAGGWNRTDDQPWAGGPTLSHAGSNTIWYCVAWVAPGHRLTVLAAANAGGPEAARACNDVILALIARHDAGVAR